MFKVKYIIKQIICFQVKQWEADEYNLKCKDSMKSKEHYYICQNTIQVTA